jgi:hypothetical protein
MQNCISMNLKHRYESDLTKFAAEFSDEAHLRSVLADLFGKAGAKGVRITHGHNEYGKDIIFYMSGGLSKDVLYACVVKNDRITGRADSDAGARTVLNQALQALNEPYTDRTTGRPERVHTVYIISPHECTTDAIESIKTQLQERARQVEFLCGIDLLAFFQEHWPDFLRFESAVLTRYLTDLRNGLTIDRPLIALLTRNNASLGLRPFESCYVPTEVEFRLDRFSAPETPVPQSDLLKTFVTASELEAAVGYLRFWKQALRSPDLAELAESTLHDLRAFIDVFRRRSKLYWDRSLATQRYRDSPVQPEERKLTVPEGSDQKYDACVLVITRVRDALVKIQRASRALRRDTEGKKIDPAALLRDTHFIEACAAYDYQSALPGLLLQTIGATVPLKPETLFGDGSATLISGPPGSGKTSFCRWHTLRAIDQFATDQNKPLPIYVAAHRLATGAVSSFEESFLGSITTGGIADDAKHRKDFPIRLFLDGLDEVPDRQQQRQIVTAIRDGLTRYPRLAVVVTARPYVWGSWLNWLPRIHVAELTSDQQYLLAQNWLGDKDSVDHLFRELKAAPSLQKLIGTPLLATLVLNLFRRTTVLPDNKVSLYRTFVDLYCGGWEAAKGISKISRFKSEHKIRLLTVLAYRMHIANKSDCDEELFRQVLRETMPLRLPEADDILTEIIQDGILVRAGKELVFAHLSFQEYLAANFLASDPVGARPKQALLSYLRGEDWWKEVVEFYIVSRDDPGILDNWIARVASGLQRKQDTAARLDRLAIMMREAFPGFGTSFTKT